MPICYPLLLAANLLIILTVKLVIYRQIKGLLYHLMDITIPSYLRKMVIDKEIIIIKNF